MITRELIDMAERIDAWAAGSAFRTRQDRAWELTQTEHDKLVQAALDIDPTYAAPKETSRVNNVAVLRKLGLLRG